jgi:hypothetical protein
MNNHWLDEVKKRLQAQSSEPSDIRFDRLRELGIINERGEVTGHLHRWDAYLAITEVKHAPSGQQIEVFRCLKPVFGMPDGASIDVSRDSMVAYVKEGKKVITARWDERLGMWKEGHEVHLSANGFVRTDTADDMEDNVGSTAEFQQSNARL